MQTYSIKKGEIEKKWLVVDATNMVLGRLASVVAQRLRGKNKPVFTPHLDTGDFVIVVNADKVRLTGRKIEYKTYFRHSGYPGGARLTDLSKLIKDKPERVIEHAVRGMLPHNRLGRSQLKKLKVYRGEKHPHQAQKPEPLAI
ncbi:50S ribosomal protein L13 [bacterium]|nr:50S ribosomal protein L13 [bacterium]